MENKNKEIRMLEVRAVDSDNEEMIVEGYAIVFNIITDLGWRKEVIDPNALAVADMSDVSMRYNHNDNYLLLARTRNKSLELTVDSKGLKIRAKLIDTTSNRDVYKSIKEGLLDKMSFAFTVRKAEWDYKTDTRKILEIDKLYDVSVVDMPAYEDTSIVARTKEYEDKEKEQYFKTKLKKRKLEMKLDL